MIIVCLGRTAVPQILQHQTLQRALALTSLVSSQQKLALHQVETRMIPQLSRMDSMIQSLALRCRFARMLHVCRYYVQLDHRQDLLL